MAIQEELIGKINNYLELDLKLCTNSQDIKNRKAVIQRFKESNGECAGFSTLWAYGKYLDSKNTDSNLNADNDITSKDDIHFFKYVTDILTAWDGNTAVSQEVKPHIDRFISNLILFQNYSYSLFSEADLVQLDLSNTLEDTKGNHPIKTLEQNFVTYKERLGEILEQTVKPHSMIFLVPYIKGEKSSHVVSLHNNLAKKTIELFDPNMESEVSATSVKDLLNTIWESTDLEGNGRGFATLDPQQLILKSFILKIFNFNNDPSYDYPLIDQETEFKNIFNKFPYLLNLGSDNPNIKNLVSLLQPLEIINLLNNNNIENNVKKVLVKFVISDEENLLPLVANYISKNYPDLMPSGIKPKDNEKNIYTFIKSDDTETSIEKITSKAILYKDYLNLEDVINVLSINPGNTDLAKILLNSCEDNTTTKPSHIIGWKLHNTIANNIKENALDTAKTILDLLGNKFDLFLTFKSLREINNEEIITFLRKKFETEYYKIGYDNDYKDQIMTEVKEIKIKQIMINNHIPSFNLVDYDVDQNLISKILDIKHALSLENVLDILYITTGNTDLAKNLLNSCKDNTTKHNHVVGWKMHATIVNCIEELAYDTAKTILDLLGNKFGLFLTSKSLIEIDNEEITTFLREKFEAVYTIENNNDYKQVTDLTQEGNTNTSEVVAIHDSELVVSGTTTTFDSETIN